MEDGTDELTQGITEKNVQLMISKAKLMIQMGKQQIDKAEKEI